MKTPLNQLPRRRFLRLTGAALGVPAILPSRVFGAEAPSNRLQLAVIGCGRIAESMDIPGLLKHPDKARIVAVADVDSRRAAWAKVQVEAAYAKSGQAEATVSAQGDYHELLSRSDIDAVVICTPDHWHAQPVVEAALAGKDIYVQKPLSLTLAEGRLVSDVVRAKRRILQIGSQQRSTRQFHRACELVRNGVLGRIREVKIGLPTDPAGGSGAEMKVPPTLNYDAWLGGTPPAPYAEDRVHPQDDSPRRRFDRPGWLRLNAYTCGMITGWGSHHVDIAHWATGTELSGPISVSASAQWPGSNSFWDVHGTYQVRLTYPGDVAWTISDELPNGIRFEGENGWILVTRGPADSPQSLRASDPGLLATPDRDLSVRLHRSPGWDHHLDWLEAVCSRREAVTNAETGHRSCSACVVSWIAMKLGRPLRWDSEMERFDDEEANRMRHRAERDPFGSFTATRRSGFSAFKNLGTSSPS
ncbi:MAG: Gfo/Idh/MocA family protein [Limisphaerales bacterium]